MKNKTNKKLPSSRIQAGGRNVASYISIRSDLFCIVPDAPLFMSLLMNACGVWEWEKHLHFKGQRLGENKISNSCHIPVVSL